MRKWKDYNTIFLSCTHLLIHLPVLNKCIHLKMIWQTMPTFWITDTEAATATTAAKEKKDVMYLKEALNCVLNPSSIRKVFLNTYFSFSPNIRQSTLWHCVRSLEANKLCSGHLLQLMCRGHYGTHESVLNKAIQNKLNNAKKRKEKRLDLLPVSRYNE